MSVTMCSGNILDNMFNGNAAIVFNGHIDINDLGKLTINTPVMAQLNRTIPEFNDIFIRAIDKLKSDDDTELTCYGLIPYDFELDGKTQKIVFMHVRNKIADDPRPQFLLHSLCRLQDILLAQRLYGDQFTSPILVEDVIRSDTNKKIVEAIRRMYDFCHPNLHIWVPE